MVKQFKIPGNEGFPFSFLHRGRWDTIPEAHAPTTSISSMWEWIVDFQTRIRLKILTYLWWKWFWLMAVYHLRVFYLHANTSCIQKSAAMCGMNWAMYAFTLSHANETNRKFRLNQTVKWLEEKAVSEESRKVLERIAITFNTLRHDFVV